MCVCVWGGGGEGAGRCVDKVGAKESECAQSCEVEAK